MDPNQNDNIYDPQEGQPSPDSHLQNPRAQDQYETSEPSSETKKIENAGSEKRPSTGNLFETQFPGVDTDKLPAADSTVNLFETNDPHQDRGVSQQFAFNDQNFSELSKGAIIDNKYEILEFIGKGGMSTVFQVRHMELGTILALKVLDKAAWQDPASASRFKIEAQAIGALTHQCLIAYRDFGISSGGQPYLVMDYVEGQDLYETLEEQGKLSLSAAYTMWIQVCEGLAVAHKKGIIHRDLKPGNIMFDATDGGQIKIVDFGVAKIVTEDANQMQNLTRTGEVFGSPLYMSPEQCKGHKVDPRSDIYSLGCVIYESITGLHPIAGNTMLDTLSNHVEKMHPPPLQLDPSLAGVERSGWVAPEDFQYILLKCLQKDPKNRYQTVDEIVEDLRKLKEKTLQKQELPKSTVSSLRKQEALETHSSPKEMINMVATVVVTVAVLGGIGVGGWYFFNTMKADADRAAADKIAIEQKKKEDALKETLSEPSINPLADNSQETMNAGTVVKIVNENIKNGEYGKAIPLLEFIIKSHKEKGTGEIFIAGDYRRLANCYAKQKEPDYKRAFSYYQQSINICKKQPGGSGAPMQKQIMKDYANALEKFGQPGKAEQMRKDADKLGML